MSAPVLQNLCDLVSELLLEEANVQPVSSPVTVCGDIHGQVGPSLSHFISLPALPFATYVLLVSANTTSPAMPDVRKVFVIDSKRAVR